ncbi:hypothetical protein RUND412_007354 [Rhizina undulata]
MKQRVSPISNSRVVLNTHRIPNLEHLRSPRIFLPKFPKPESKSSIPVFALTSPPSLVPQQPPVLFRFPRPDTPPYLPPHKNSTNRYRPCAGDRLNKIYLEFYAGANVILVDTESSILAVLRIVPTCEDGRGECKVGAKYNVEENMINRVIVSKLTIMRGASASGAKVLLVRRRGKEKLKGETRNRLPLCYKSPPSAIRPSEWPTEQFLINNDGTHLVTFLSTGASDIAALIVNILDAFSDVAPPFSSLAEIQRNIDI